MNGPLPPDSTARYQGYLRYFLRLFLPVALLVLAGSAVIQKREYDRNVLATQAVEAARVGSSKALLEERLAAMVIDLQEISGLPSLKSALTSAARPDAEHLAEDIKNYMRSHPACDQVRWIDDAGWERLRINRDGQMARIVPPRDLQYKGGRDYVQATEKLSPGQIHVSALDLNIENNEIEKPHKPTIRVATPLTGSNGKRAGVLVVNVLGERLLDVFRGNSRGHGGRAMLLNLDGYWLSSPDPRQEWGFVLATGESFARSHAAAWEHIRGQDYGQFRDREGLWTFTTIRLPSTPLSDAPLPQGQAAPFWKSVHLTPEDQLALPRVVVAQIWLSALLVLLGFAFGTYRLARSQAREAATRQAIGRLNAELEDRVHERTEELEVALAQIRETESKFRGLVEQSFAGIYILQDDRFRYANPGFASIFGYGDPAEIVDRVLAIELVAPTDRERVAGILRGDATEAPEQIGFIGIRPDGQSVDIEVYPRRIQYQGHEAQIGLVLDVSERKRNEQKLRQAATVFESTREGVVMTDMAGLVQAINPAFTAVTGYAEEDVIGRSLKILKSGRQDEEFYRNLWQSLHSTGFWQGELWNRRKNGDIYPEWLTISAVVDAGGRQTNFVGVFTDLTRVKKSEQELARLAHYDPLTGLPNRLLVSTRLESAIGRTNRRRKRGAVLHLDLDRFKDINDSLGHTIGDAVLKDVAASLKSRIRESDTLARLGADEFLVLLEDIDEPEDAAAVANVLIEQLRRPFLLADGSRVHTGCSIGISVFPDDSTHAGQLLQFADTALHQAKARGRGVFHFYTESLGASANERLAMESALRHALTEEEFVLHYQPLLDLESNTPVGAEVLVRWQRASGELVSPARFISLAEDSGLIIPLGGWILRTACAQGRKWLDQGLPLRTLAVNVSPRQLNQQNLVEEIASILEATGLPPQVLELELTEGALAEHERGIEILLRDLKAVGVRLAIDDFGTGYSSLSYLKRFPIDKLKIDQSFVRDIPDDPAGMEIAATVVAMGRNLKLKVLAEGIETDAQREFLLRHGCQDGQGYLFSRPLPADEFRAWFERGGLPTTKSP